MAEIKRNRGESDHVVAPRLHHVGEAVPEIQAGQLSGSLRDHLFDELRHDPFINSLLAACPYKDNGLDLFITGVVFAWRYRFPMVGVLDSPVYNFPSLLDHVATRIKALTNGGHVPFEVFSHLGSLMPVPLNDIASAMNWLERFDREEFESYMRRGVSHPSRLFMPQILNKRFVFPILTLDTNDTPLGTQQMTHARSILQGLHDARLPVLLVYSEQRCLDASKSAAYFMQRPAFDLGRF